MARTFDGVDDQIAFGSEAAIDDVAAFTAMAIVRITADITSEKQIFTKMNSSFTGKMFLACEGGGGNNNKVFVLVSGSANWDSRSAVNALAVDTWRVIISTWVNTTAVAPKLYGCNIGGSLAELSYTSQAGGSGVASDAAATLRIAARDPLDATFFPGGVAECALWNRVLSLDEMAALGRGFSPAFFPNGRIAYCPVDGRHSPELNLADGSPGTVTGTTYLEHPPVIYPGKYAQLGRGSAAATFNAAWAATANVILGTGPR